jgi:fluoroacetyl-CoA thioesterase
MNASSFTGIVPGLRGERRALVTAAMATTHAGGPGVLMAAWMILEMELAAQDSTQPFLPADRRRPSMAHADLIADARVVGEEFTVSSELLEVDDRKLLFRVEARNAREVIGEGTLRRTIVQRGRLGTTPRDSGP